MDDLILTCQKCEKDWNQDPLDVDQNKGYICPICGQRHWFDPSIKPFQNIVDELAKHLQDQMKVLQDFIDNSKNES